MTARSSMQLTTRLGVDFWNDSCHPRELAEAIAHGAVGATSNPVIVGQVVESDQETWLPVIDALGRTHPGDTEDEIAWRLIGEMAQRGARLLEPVFRATQGQKGFLSVQVDPRLHANAARMIEHGAHLASLAPNIAVKIPATMAGIAAIEALTARGIRINATVCTTLSQALACAEAVERGLEPLRARGAADTPAPNVTIMVGRLDDHLRRVMEAERVSIAPGHLDWAGIAVFKSAYRLFRERGYQSQLLAAAYRHHLHWTELIGDGVAETIPYAWWTRFNASGVVPRRSIEEPVEAATMSALVERFADFRRANEEGALRPDAFARYGASVHTLRQFLGGTTRLVEIVRARLVV